MVAVTKKSNECPSVCLALTAHNVRLLANRNNVIIVQLGELLLGMCACVCVWSEYCEIQSFRMSSGRLGEYILQPTTSYLLHSICTFVLDCASCERLFVHCVLRQVIETSAVCTSEDKKHDSTRVWITA